MERVDLNNNQIWARLTMLVLWVQMVYSLLAILIYYSLHSLITSQPLGLGYGKKQNWLEANLLQFELPLSIIIIVLFLIWFWRVYANFHVLHPEKATFGKIWALIGWFIPFLNFYIPFVIMREIWLENQEDDEDFVEEKRYRWVIWWWISFLIQFVNEVVLEVVRYTGTDWETIYFMLICKYSNLVISAALAIMLVFKINQSEQKLRKAGEELDIYDHLVDK